MVSVPEGHAIVARRFIAGLAVHRDLRPGGTLELDLGCYESAVPDGFKVEIATRRTTSPAQEEPSQRNNDVPKIRPPITLCYLCVLLCKFSWTTSVATLRIQASLRDAGPTGSGTRR
jgi:hypothetical protein